MKLFQQKSDGTLFVPKGRIGLARCAADDFVVEKLVLLEKISSEEVATAETIRISAATVAIKANDFDDHFIIVDRKTKSKDLFYQAASLLCQVTGYFALILLVSILADEIFQESPLRYSFRVRIIWMAVSFIVVSIGSFVAKRSRARKLVDA